jgi:SAM-dependent methyltransferase
MDKLEKKHAIAETLVIGDTRITEPPAAWSPEAPPFSNVADPACDPHLNGEYFKNNPTWHVEYSAWKADNIHGLIKRKGLHPKAIGDVGCGAGKVLSHLQCKLEPDCHFWGFDVAPEAIRMARADQNERMHFEAADFGEITTPFFDLLLVLEVVDHVENYLGFLRMLKSRSDLKLFSFSLDISAQSALRAGAFLQRRDVHSHLHHFNKETALSTLRYTGYEVLDHFYVPSLAFSSLAKMAKPVRNLLFSVAPDLTVRMLGGYSLMVLAK